QRTGRIAAKIEGTVRAPPAASSRWERLRPMIILYHSLPIVSGSIKVVRTSVTVSIVVALLIIGFRGGLTMINQAIFVLASVAAIGCGLVAGIFFAFSSFVMAALGSLPSDHGIA